MKDKQIIASLQEMGREAAANLFCQAFPAIEKELKGRMQGNHLCIDPKLGSYAEYSHLSQKEFEERVSNLIIEVDDYSENSFAEAATITEAELEEFIQERGDPYERMKEILLIMTARANATRAMGALMKHNLLDQDKERRGGRVIHSGIGMGYESIQDLVHLTVGSERILERFGKKSAEWLIKALMIIKYRINHKELIAAP